MCSLTENIGGGHRSGGAGDSGDGATVDRAIAYYTHTATWSPGVSGSLKIFIGTLGQLGHCFKNVYSLRHYLHYINTFAFTSFSKTSFKPVINSHRKNMRYSQQGDGAGRRLQYASTSTIYIRQN